MSHARLSFRSLVKASADEQNIAVEALFPKHFPVCARTHATIAAEAKYFGKNRNNCLLLLSRWRVNRVTFRETVFPATMFLRWRGGARETRLTRGVLPIVDYTGRLRPEGVPFFKLAVY